MQAANLIPLTGAEGAMHLSNRRGHLGSLPVRVHSVLRDRCDRSKRNWSVQPVEGFTPNLKLSPGRRGSSIQTLAFLHSLAARTRACTLSAEFTQGKWYYRVQVYRVNVEPSDAPLRVP